MGPREFEARLKRDLKAYYHDELGLSDWERRAELRLE
jgi:hypothetical protein